MNELEKENTRQSYSICSLFSSVKIHLLVYWVISVSEIEYTPCQTPFFLY